jgi:methyltransferase (TIGR00027 family)
LMMAKNEIINISSVGETALLTLYARAIESQSQKPILNDEKAEEMVQQLDPILQKRKTNIARQLLNRAIDPKLVVHISLRSEKYDRYAKEFLKNHLGGTIINLGCGLDTRFHRIDDGKLQCVDIDLPEMIALKHQLLSETGRYRMVARSILDHAWMEEAVKTPEPYCFLLEGVLMYLPEGEVKRLILALRDSFPGSEMVCEVTHRQWVKGVWGKLAALKMQKRTKIGQAARFHFGLSRPDEMEDWGEGIKYLDNWFYMDEEHPKIGWMRIFRNWKIFRTAQYTAHYRFY